MKEEDTNDNENRIQELIKQLNCGDLEPEHEASYALREIGEKAVPVLIKEFKSGDWKRRIRAIWTISFMGDLAKPVIPELKRQLAEEKSRDRKFHLALYLGRTERDLEGEGLRVLQEMNDKNELAEWEKVNYERLRKELLKIN